MPTSDKELAFHFCFDLPEQAMEQLGKKHQGVIEPICPACGMARSEWPQGEVIVNGTVYCCRGCAEGTGCTCRPRSPEAKVLEEKARGQIKR